MKPLRQHLAAPLLALVFVSTLFGQGAPSGPPLAAGHAKFLGGIYSTPQSPNLTAYFNQVTPENAGKWASVEGARDVMNWTELDAAYALAKSNGLPFRFHVLIWGNQQPAWIESLPAAQQLEEIREWFEAVAARYPDLDYLEVVNEPISDPPDGPGDGNYINALGGTGTSGWDWVLTAFRLAREIFPASTKLMLNEFSITNETSRMNRYVGIINLLLAERLIDAVGVQGHAFSTRNSAASTRANLDLLALTGLPIMVTEMDIDGGTPAAPNDTLQLSDYQRIFPAFWEHPAVMGITLWGYRPGLWRNDQAAYLVRQDGSERPAMDWLRTYLANHPPVVVAGQRFSAVQGTADGTAIGTVRATDQDGNNAVQGWSITGGTGANVFAIDAASGQLTVSDSAALAAAAADLTLNVTASDGRDSSAAEAVAIRIHQAGTDRSRLVNIATRAYCGTGDNVAIGGFVVQGSAPKRVLVRAVGPSLASRGIAAANVLTDPMVSVFRGSTVFASNDNWGDNANAAEIGTVGAQIGAGALEPTDSASSALLLTLDPGVYTFVVSGKNSAVGIVLLEVFDAEIGSSGSQFMNIATRAYATTGDGVAIGGFVISGQTHKQVLLRAVGISLSQQGVPRTLLLPDPVIALHDANNANALVATNGDAGNNSNAPVIPSTSARIGAAPLAIADARSSTLLVTLAPGVYTFVASGGASAPSGIVLVEVYDAD